MAGTRRSLLDCVGLIEERPQLQMRSACEAAVQWLNGDLRGCISLFRVLHDIARHGGSDSHGQRCSGTDASGHGRYGLSVALYWAGIHSVEMAAGSGAKVPSGAASLLESAAAHGHAQAPMAIARLELLRAAADRRESASDLEVRRARCAGMRPSSVLSLTADLSDRVVNGRRCADRRAPAARSPADPAADTTGVRTQLQHADSAGKSLTPLPPPRTRTHPLHTHHTLSHPLHTPPHSQGTANARTATGRERNAGCRAASSFFLRSSLLVRPGWGLAGGSAGTSTSGSGGSSSCAASASLSATRREDCGRTSPCFRCDLAPTTRAEQGRNRNHPRAARPCRAFSAASESRAIKWPFDRPGLGSLLYVFPRSQGGWLHRLMRHHGLAQGQHGGRVAGGFGSACAGG